MVRCILLPVFNNAASSPLFAGGPHFYLVFGMLPNLAKSALLTYGLPILNQELFC
jgi:hypothetical protein